MGGAEVDAKSCVIFLKAAETGSITKAALALGYTQAGVSLVVRKIEEECGFHLLIREKNGVRLTDAGARLLPIMREIARWDERFRETAAEINGVSTGTVRVGCYSSIAYHWMPRVIRAFRVNHPKIAIDILEGSVDEIERWIEERRVDVGFLSARRGQRFHTVALAQDSVLVLLPPEHPLCAAEAFPLSALGGMPFIGLRGKVRPAPRHEDIVDWRRDYFDGRLRSRRQRPPGADAARPQRGRRREGDSAAFLPHDYHGYALARRAVARRAALSRPHDAVPAGAGRGLKAPRSLQIFFEALAPLRRLLFETARDKQQKLFHVGEVADV